MRNGHFASPWAWLALSWALLLALLLAGPHVNASRVSYLPLVVSDSENGAGQAQLSQTHATVASGAAHASNLGSPDAIRTKADHSNPLTKKSALTDGGTPIYRS